MILRDEVRTPLDDKWEIERAEADRIMKELGIKHPRCGFGVGLGWMPVVEECLKKMVALGWDKDLHQVKQKFCGLRIYIGAGMYDNVDTPVKKFFREKILKPVALAKFIPARIRIKVWDVIHSRFFRENKPSAIAAVIDEAEAECNRLCERCGNERQHKGFDMGMALCNDCGIPYERQST